MPVSFQYVRKETAINLRRNAFITVAAVLVVVVSLYLVGAVLVASFALDRAITLQTRKVEVAVFLNKTVTAEERDSIEGDIVAMPEVASVQYESKQEAYESFKELFRDEPDIVAATTPDSLPESFRVKLKDPNEFEVVRDRLDGRPGIDKIRDEREFLRRLLDFVGDVRLLGVGVVLLLGLAAFVLIATTIRMALFARRREIGIMKLVGATNWFIRIPFMLEGVIQGVIGSVLAMALLLATRPFYVGALDSLAFLNLSVSYLEIARHAGWILPMGIAIGALGSLLGLRRFLDV
ncbi:MAG: permease-like cell division protein FtsX [Actinomycetota bacterium]